MTVVTMSLTSLSRRLFPSSSRRLVACVGALPLLFERSVAAQEAASPLALFLQGEAPPAVVSLAGIHRREDKYLAPLEGGGEAVLTLQPRLQEAAEKVLAAYDLPFGAAVVLSVPD